MMHRAESGSQKPPGASWETGVALAGTGFIAFMLFLLTINAGPLWRDETNSINIAQMSSRGEFWNNMAFESFPALWLLILRGYNSLGLAASDAGIRMLGFFVGLAFLGSLWFSARRFGARGPILSLALLGCLPFFFFTVQSNRAYGLAMCLLVLSFGAFWLVVQSPTPARIIWAGIVSLLFVHCVYYDVVFLCAMLFGASLVLARRRQWKAVAALAGVSASAASTLIIYMPILKKASAYAPMIRTPFNLSLLWDKLCEALTACSGPQPAAANPMVWVWILLVALGVAGALVVLLPGAGSTSDATVANPGPLVWAARVREDLALFSLVSLLLGSAAHLSFLLKLQFPTEPWYYFGMLSLCGIALDGLLTANWAAPRPWGFLRIGFMVVMLAWGARSVWQEARTRRSNIDLIADVLGREAGKEDLIVVQGAWEGLGWDRYYQGATRWVTVPPIGSHKVHRTDLMWDAMNEPDPIGPLLAQITSTLRNSNTVWVVGRLVATNPSQLAAAAPSPLPTRRWLGEYLWYWISQVSVHLSRSALEMKVIESTVDGPVSRFENLPLQRFSGYLFGPDEENRPPR